MIKSLPLLRFVLFFFSGGIQVIAQTSSADVVHQATISQSLSSPHRIALDYFDNIYVSDAHKKCIFVYSPAGVLTDSIFVGYEPLSVAINSENVLFVSDAFDGKIYKVISGNVILFYDGCTMPSSMTFGKDGLLYVVDSKLKKVIALDISANIVKNFGTGTLIYPSSITIDETNNRILISEHGGIGGGMTPVCKVWKFDLNGTLIGSFGSAGNTNGKFYRIQGMTIGRCGNIYVCDPYLGRISVFDENNVFKTTFGVFGDSLTQLNIPLGVVFDSQERVLVASMNNRKVEIFNILDSLPGSNIVNSDANICNGENTDIEIRFTGTAPWTFTYTVDGLNPTQIVTSDNPYLLNASVSGIYEVISLSDANYNGICFTGSAKVNVFNQLPQSFIPDSTYIVCEGETVSIPVSFTGNSPWTFTYTVNGLDPQTIQTANSLYTINTIVSGNYQIAALNDAGCTGTVFNGNAQILTNPKPVASFASGNARFEICTGDSLELGINLSGTAPWTFTYMVDEYDTTTITTYSNFYSLYTNIQGSYDIIAVSDSLCVGQYGTTYPELIVNPLPTAHLDSVIATTCQGNGVTFPIHFTGTGPWTLALLVDSNIITTVNNIDQNPFDLSAYQPGHYQLYNVNDANCYSDIVSGGAEIYHNTLPLLELGTDTSLCEGTDLVLDAGSSYSYLWSDNSTQQTLSVNQTGIYSVTVTDINGCFASDEITVNFQAGPIALFSYTNNLLEISFQNQSSNGTSYLWDFGDGNTSTEFNPIYSYSNPGTYTVTLTVSNGLCPDNSIFQTINVTAVNVDEASDLSVISIYPVPSDGIFFIKSNKIFEEGTIIEVSDILGEIVYSNILSNYGSHTKIDLQTLSSGFYTLVISDKSQSNITRIVINK